MALFFRNKIIYNRIVIYEGGYSSMKYDWVKIIADQKNSGISIKKYCETNKISQSAYYKAVKRLEESEIAEPHFSPLKMTKEEDHQMNMMINGHKIEFDPELLTLIIGALK